LAVSTFHFRNCWHGHGGAWKSVLTYLHSRRILAPHHSGVPGGVVSSGCQEEHMKRLALVVLAGAIAAACSGAMPAGPGPVAAGPANATDAKPSAGVPRNWVAHLGGDQEVPTPRDTQAQGQVKFQLSADGTELRWRLIASNIDNVFMAHIHMAPAGSNGGIVLWLYGTPPSGNPPGPGSGPQDGVLSSGVAEASDLVNALAGQPLSALIAAMDAGNAYVNVHTNDGVAPTNTGPGDFPGGEVRGQIRSAGHDEGN
jgi:hypothetical protein